MRGYNEGGSLHVCTAARHVGSYFARLAHGGISNISAGRADTAEQACACGITPYNVQPTMALHIHTYPLSLYLYPSGPYLPSPAYLYLLRAIFPYWSHFSEFRYHDAVSRVASRGPRLEEESRNKNNFGSPHGSAGRWNSALETHCLGIVSEHPTQLRHTLQTPSHGWRGADIKIYIWRSRRYF